MRYAINLVGEKKRNLSENALFFFLNYLRYILVITQLVVIGVLFYRFTIDQSIIDLKDTVQQKKEIVKTVAPLIAEAKRVNGQTTEIKRIVIEQDMQQKLLDYIFSEFPASARLSEFKIEESVVTLTGVSTTARDIQLYYNKLNQDGRFKLVDLTELRKQEVDYSFILQLTDFVN